MPNWRRESRRSSELAAPTLGRHPQRPANWPAEPRLIRPRVQGETSSPRSRQAVPKPGKFNGRAGKLAAATEGA